MAGVKGRSGGARKSTRPDAKRAGRRKTFASVRIPIFDVKPILDALMPLHATMERGTPAEVGMAFLVAGLWSEINVAE